MKNGYPFRRTFGGGPKPKPGIVLLFSNIFICTFEKHLSGQKRLDRRYELDVIDDFS